MRTVTTFMVVYAKVGVHRAMQIAHSTRAPERRLNTG